MKKRNLRFLAAVFLAGCSLDAFPQDANVVVKMVEDEVPKVFAINGISRVSFRDGKVVVIGSDGVDAGEYGIPGVDRIIFDLEGKYGAIRSAGLGVSHVRIWPNPTVDDVYVEGLAPGDCEVSVYSLTGAEVMRWDGLCGNRIPLGALQRGTYLLKVGNNTFKVIKL